MRVLVTGAAGFIGFHTSKKLLELGANVLGFDSINDYYDPAHKHARLDILNTMDGFRFVKGDLTDFAALRSAWQGFRPEIIVHLAAQAGVRYSLENPMAYIQSNIVGFQHMIDLARETQPKNFVYASSSSVYGGNKEYPFSESQNVNSPISLYAATKASNELVAKTYSHLFKIPTTGLRFFTVYGPNSRPDMAMFKFAELMRAGKPIPVFHGGNMVRDFTYVDDIVAGILACVEKPEQGQVYNLGKGSPENLMDMIHLLEQETGLKATLELLPMQPGDVEKTVADISKARKNLNYEPKTNLTTGVKRFGQWYKNYRGLA